MAAAILLIIPLLIWSSIASAQNVGTVQTYAGSVKLERAGHPVVVTTRMAVLAGDRFTTGPGGRLIIRLNDQSTLDLYESGEMVLNEQVVRPNGQAITRVSLLSGVLHSNVHETAGGPAPDFEVRTPNGVAADRGTDFDTSYHP